MEPVARKFDADGEAVARELEAIRKEYAKLSAKLNLIELRSHNIELNRLRSAVACQSPAGLANITRMI